MSLVFRWVYLSLARMYLVFKVNSVTVLRTTKVQYLKRYEIVNTGGMIPRNEKKTLIFFLKKPHYWKITNAQKATKDYTNNSHFWNKMLFSMALHLLPRSSTPPYNHPSQRKQHWCLQLDGIALGPNLLRASRQIQMTL